MSVGDGSLDRMLPGGGSTICWRVVPPDGHLVIVTEGVRWGVVTKVARGVVMTNLARVVVVTEVALFVIADERVERDVEAGPAIEKTQLDQRRGRGHDRADLA